MAVRVSDSKLDVGECTCPSQKGSSDTEVNPAIDSVMNTEVRPPPSTEVGPTPNTQVGPPSVTGIGSPAAFCTGLGTTLGTKVGSAFGTTMSAKLGTGFGNPSCSTMTYGTSPLRCKYMVKYSDRIDSFYNYPIRPFHPRPSELAVLGFYYTGVGDKVCCFCCNIVVDGWTESQNAINEHYKWSLGNCNFLKYIERFYHHL